ncbi:hypothetical protein [Streptomyces sp. G-5]|uniref:hypothetical protein n=1 Tax=Streptomyces sp. G-5 TaxID=2977231 RepID=UPI0021D0EED5|nr:hypothetical protein [Streptomyces sp. G-5]MCU4750222.1 hypothetical protein [Streptomyces sp. G-5]
MNPTSASAAPSWLLRRQLPDRQARLIELSEVMLPDGSRLTVELHRREAHADRPARRWVVRAEYRGETRTVRRCRGYADDSNGSLKAAWAQRKGWEELLLLGELVHRRACWHCRLGVVTRHGEGRSVHQLTGEPACPDGQGTDCNVWEGSGFQPEVTDGSVW